MILVGWIMGIGVIVGVIAAVVIVCWVTRIWSPAEWKAQARIARIERGGIGDDDTATVNGGLSAFKLLLIIVIAVVVVLLMLRVFAYCDANRWVDPLARSSVMATV